MHSAFENLWSDLTGDVSTAHNRAVYELGIEHRLERADLRACLQFGGLSAATISFVGARLREEVRKKLLKEDSSQHLSLDPGASE
jgi:hypothetical protein